MIRPLIAKNLALGRPWYSGFVRLMTALDDNGNPIRNKLSFEKKGLNAMSETAIMWDHDGEAAIVRAVHDALRNRYGRIADENKNAQAAMKRRFTGEYDRWRLAFAGAKTPEQFRKALCDLFSRAGNNAVLKDSWSALLPFFGEATGSLRVTSRLLRSQAIRVAAKAPTRRLSPRLFQSLELGRIK